jgi:hypothetical protein
MGCLNEAGRPMAEVHFFQTESSEQVQMVVLRVLVLS